MIEFLINLAERACIQTSSPPGRLAARPPPPVPAQPVGIPLTEVSTTEGSDPDYIANEGQSCFHCKTHLYSALEAVAAQAGVEARRSSSSSNSSTVGRHRATADPSRVAEVEVEAEATGGERRKVVLFNGTNKDDKRDTTRWVAVMGNWWW